MEMAERLRELHTWKEIAKFWGTYLNQQITPVDVAAMMALLKLARVAEGHAKEDNWVDLAGYAACGAEIESGGSCFGTMMGGNTGE